MSYELRISRATSVYHDSNEEREKDSRAKGEHFDADGIDHLRLHDEQLPALIHAAKVSLERMPYQERPLAQVHLVEVVAKTLAALDFKPSKSVTSKFHRACEAAFEIANVQVQAVGKSRPTRPSPTGSIRAFMANRGRHSRWMW